MIDDKFELDKAILGFFILAGLLMAFVLVSVLWTSIEKRNTCHEAGGLWNSDTKCVIGSTTYDITSISEFGLIPRYRITTPIIEEKQK